MAVSAWITHVKKYAKANNCEFGEALKKAGPSYRSSSSSSSAPTKKAKRSRGKRSKRGKTSKRRR